MKSRMQYLGAPTVDVCVVGGGTLGLYMASDLSQRGQTVLLLEAGSSRGDRRSQLIGSSPLHGGHRGSVEGWTTGLGGTSQLWGGQLWPWQDWEFSGNCHKQVEDWPLDASEIRPFYQHVLKFLGLPMAHSDIHHLAGSASTLPSELNEHFRLVYSSWIDRGRRNFFQNRLITSRLNAVHVSSGSVVTRIHPTNFEYSEVDYRDAAGMERTARARTIVLAAGTLGNTRILSASDISKDLPALGSGFMDHVSKRIAEFEVSDWGKFRSFAAPRKVKGVMASPRIVPTLEFLQSQGVLPAYAHWEFESPQHGAVASVRAALSARQLGGERPNIRPLLGDVAADFSVLAESVAQGVMNRQRPVPRNVRPYLRVDVEQPARRDVYLRWKSDSSDPSGRHLEISWRSGAEEENSATAVGDEVLGLLSKRDIGATLQRRSADWVFEDIFHMMGGTRMSSSVKTGVVDRNLKVYGTTNVFVAGASVFPSGGMANPTFTALALAARLGDHIAG